MIPAAVVALVFSVIGLEWVALWFMGLGLRWILGVAHEVAALDGARGFVPGPGSWVIPLLTLGFLVVVLWQGRLRWTGVVAMAASFVLWHGVERPFVLIADNGSLVGVMTPQGRALSKPKGAGFIADNWLENDGDGAAQDQAAARWIGGAVIHLTGKRALAGFAGCEAGEIVVTSVSAPDLANEGCEVFDPDRLKQTGSIALTKTNEGWQMITARELAEDRPWTNWPKVRDTNQYVRISPTKRP